MFGFLNVYKPKGITSHDVVAILRRITKIKQIGHTGTLDPFAEGVLPVCFGKSTRLIEYLDDDKEYIGTIQLGSSTTTYDVEGEVVNKSDKIVTKDEINTALENFKGEIVQIPPIYSAIKVKGKKLYEYARKGEEVKIEPRRVIVNELELLKYNKEKQQVELKIACSKGTYIRSIANDLGEKLETYGHLVKLVRTKAGLFKAQNSIKLENLSSVDDVKKYLLYPLEYLSLQRYELNKDQLERVSHGMSLKAENISDGNILLTSEGQIIAVGNVSNGVIKCNKVFI